MTIIIGVLEQGFIYGILALGVYITYKILDFPDLTVDSSFPLGAAITVQAILHGINPAMSLMLSFLAGCLAGLCTGLINVKCHVRDLLSGIITMTGLYSINLHIAGKANVPIFDMPTIFKNETISSLPPAAARFSSLVIILFITLIAKLLLDMYLKTKSGYLLRAVGDNPIIVSSLAKDSGTVKIIGLMISNGLVALSGGVMGQWQRFFELSMGTGAIVIGLASVIIGINAFKRIDFLKATTAVIIGSIIYKACVALAIKLGLGASDMKLVTAVLFLVILVLGFDRKKKVKKSA